MSSLLFSVLIIDKSDKAIEKFVSYCFPKQNKTGRLQKVLHCWTHLFTSTNGEEPVRYPSFVDVIPSESYIRYL